MRTPEQQFERFRERADGGALAAVFDALAPELLLVAAHVAPAGAEPEDLVQATFLEAIEKAAKWDRTRPLMPWLIGLLVHHARIERRRLGRTVDAARLPPRGETLPDEAAAADEMAQRVAEAVASMPRKYRQVLTLRLVHGLTSTQIAQALGCPVATAKTRLQRGMELLRKVLPAGIAASAAGLLGAGRGLAQVRVAVLAHARAALQAAAGTVAAGLVGGGLAMKKLALVALAALSAAALWLVLPVLPDAEAPQQAAPRAESLTARVPERAGAGEVEAPSPGPAARSAVPLAEKPATGAIALELVWKRDGSPAAHLRVSADAVAEDGGETVEARADQQGRIQLDGLEPGQYLLFGRKLWHRTSIRAGEETRERLEVEASARIDGVVVDADGRGVAGADVYLQYFPDPQDDAPRLVATSGPDGAFHAAADQAGWVWARKAGFAPRSIGVGTLEGRVELRLVLDAAGCGVRGTVLGADGEPAAGARLTILDRTGRPHPAPVVLRSGARGKFATSELAAGEHLVVAQAEGHAATPVTFTTVAGGEQLLNVRLSPGATVEGSVCTTSGTPVRTRLEARPVWAGGGSAWVEARRPLYHLCAVRGSNDADGRYRLEHVPHGAVVLTAEPDEPCLPAAQELLLGEGGLTTCDFAVAIGGEIRGRLLDARGAPLPMWWVDAHPVGSGIGRATITDAQGSFVIQGLDAPEYAVTAGPMAAGERRPWARAAGVRPGRGELVLRAEHVPEDGGRFTGRALAADGAVAEAAAIQLHLAGEPVVRAQRLELDAEGLFETGRLPPGRYRVSVHVGGEGGVDLGTHDLSARERIDLGVARVPASGTLEVRLRTAEGRALEPEELVAWGAAGNGGPVFERMADGSWRSGPLPAGGFTLFAWGTDFARVLQRVVVQAGRVTPVEVLAEAAAPVTFAVRCGDRAGAGRWTLEVRDAAGKPLATRALAVDPDEGAALTLGLPSGSYTCEVRGRGEPVRRAFEVRGLQAQRVEVLLPWK